MSQPADISDRVSDLHKLLVEKLGGRAKADAGLDRFARRLPRTVRADLKQITTAQPMLAHPKLRLTQDTPAMRQRIDRVTEHVSAIDLADRRKGWILGMLGGLAFNLLLFFAILVVIYVWRSSP